MLLVLNLSFSFNPYEKLVINVSIQKSYLILIYIYFYSQYHFHHDHYQKESQLFRCFQICLCKKYWNDQLWLDKLFYFFCVDSYEYVIHLLFPLHTVYQIFTSYKINYVTCMIIDIFKWQINNEMFFAWYVWIEKRFNF